MNYQCSICENNREFVLPEEIIAAAQNENLVLFCGAGISTEGKGVMPTSLYEDVRNELNIGNENPTFSDLMQKYCDKPDGRRKLMNKIKARFDYIHSFPELERSATNFHRELADIYQIRTIITTNWDTYFERFCGATPITTPDDVVFWDEKSRFVIKIHGSIDNLGSLIMTHDDYIKCYDSSKNGIIWAELKVLLTTKTIVFVGFSFGDEDFNQIIDHLREEMGELYPHIYIITLDDSFQKKIQYKNATIINTSGAFFIQKLKDELAKYDFLTNLSSCGKVNVALEIMNEFHKQISGIYSEGHSCSAYTLAYQDGVIHAWERYLQNRTGDYCKPGYISLFVNNYEKLVQKYEDVGDYWNASYYRGYIEGLIFIGVCDKEDDALSFFPFFYLPSVDDYLSSYEEYIDRLKIVSACSSKYVSYAKELYQKNSGKELVLHHPPY